MIAINLSVLWQILLFLGLWLIVSKVLFRPYMAVLEEREQKTSGADDSSEHLEQEAERLRVQYEEAIAKAAAAGNATKHAIVQQARQQREALLSSARAVLLTSIACQWTLDARRSGWSNSTSSRDRSPFSRNRCWAKP